MERSRRPRLEVSYAPEPKGAEMSQFPDKPVAVPRDAWALYEQLTCELARAECILRNIRARLEAAKQQLSCRIEAPHDGVQDEALERLAAAVPATELLQ